MNRVRTLPATVFLLAAAAFAAGQPLVDRDIQYEGDDDPARQLDVYSPQALGTEARPVLIYVHGGGWFKGDKSKVGRKPEWLTGFGFVLVSVNHRLLPRGRHPLNGEDLASAVAWVHRRIAGRGGDPRAIFLMGHSTGAHLVSLVATDERFLAAHELGLDVLAGVVALDTNAYDIESRIRSLAPEDRGLYLAAFGGRPAGWRDASPLVHVTPGKPIPPFLLLTAGALSSTHPQTERFARALAGAGASVRTEPYPAETHGSLNQRLGKPRHPPTVAVEAFLREVLAARNVGDG